MLACLLLAGSAAAQTYTVAPSAKFIGLDSNGNPLSSGKLCTYVSGTTTPATTYISSSGTANANPVILDSAGRADIWLAPGQAYKFVLRSAGSDTTCTTGTIQWTVDGIPGVPTTSGNTEVLGTAGEALTAGDVVYLSDGSGGAVPGTWRKADADNTYSSTLPIIGMVPNAIANGSVGTVRLNGQITGLSSLSVGSTYYASATAGALTTTAPANRRIVGVADTTSSIVLSPALPSTTTTSTITTTGTQTALAIPVGDGPLTIFANNATLLTLQGITAGRDGQSLTIYSIGAGQVDLANQNGSATAALRIINGVTGTISLAAGSGRVALLYDSTTARWRVREHEQGAFITPTFAGGDFTGNGSLTWTVETGTDAITVAYYLRGRKLTVAIRLDTTSTGGVASTLLQISNNQWGGFTAAKSVIMPATVLDAGGAEQLGSIDVAAAGTVIRFAKVPSANWSAAAANNTYARGELTFEVQ